ncbi:MAG: winged helix-turn-helix domain-containing protein [Oscillospiraceae bacterium]
MPVHLTKTEYAILKLLMQNPNQVISKTVILERIFEDIIPVQSESLKQHISNLRKKLRDAGNKEHIEAVWGIGFKMKF